MGSGLYSMVLFRTRELNDFTGKLEDGHFVRIADIDRHMFVRFEQAGVFPLPDHRRIESFASAPLGHIP